MVALPGSGSLASLAQPLYRRARRTGPSSRATARSLHHLRRNALRVLGAVSAVEPFGTASQLRAMPIAGTSSRLSKGPDLPATKGLQASALPADQHRSDHP